MSPRIQCLTCRAIGPWGRSGRCTTCRIARQRAKDRTPQRIAQKAKYGPEHRATRARWTPLVASGSVACWRCGERIVPGTSWHLGHRPDAPSAPEHATCNLRHSNEGKTPR